MTIGKNRIASVMMISLLIAAAMLFMSFTDLVWAEDSDADSAPNKKELMLQTLSLDEGTDNPLEQGVHNNPETFEKNFDLSWEQKVSTIKRIEEVAGGLKDADMSDLEKYYTLAIEANQLVSYDWHFWNCGYDFDYYSHQWDSYGALNEKSVCVGIAIFYTHLCHAADLPCWFARVVPDSLDHTISYIPDINGNAYYIDVTENYFFMSDKSNPYSPMDKEFSHITKNCTDTSFDYLGEDGDWAPPAFIKDFYDVPYADWFREYAEHDKTITTKNFPTEYVEKGSGLRPSEEGSYHASYKEYRSNFTEKGDIWFLDDFYRNPAATKAKIQNKEFDPQLVNVSGVKKNYDYANVETLEANIVNDISRDISVQYFPSVNEDGEIVAKADELEKNVDYEVIYNGYSDETKTAELTVQCKQGGKYTGAYPIQVKINSAVVTKDPVSKKGLTYTGKAQALAEAGEAEFGEMQYALGTEDGPTEDFSKEIPTATDAGKYYVWYKAAGTDASHADSEAKCIERAISIAPITLNIVAINDMEINAGETATISPKLDNAKVQAKFKFESGDEDIATVDNKGVVTGVKGGFANIYIEAVLKQPSSNYKILDGIVVTIEVIEPFDISETKVRFYKSSFTYNGKVQKPQIKTIKGWKLKAGTDYTFVIKNSKGKKVSSPKAAGTYKVIVKGKGKYTGSTDATYTIAKTANPMSLKAKTVKLKRKTLKKKSKIIKMDKAFTVSNAKGKLSYKLVSAKKGKKSFKKKFKVNAKTGKITVKKKLKRGTYTVKVKVKAAGNANYKASVWKTVTFKVRVK